jgi:hypothetical protein
MARYNPVPEQIQEVVKNLEKMLQKYNTAISQKTILKKAGRPALTGIRNAAAEIKDTGALMRSAEWIKTKSKRSVMAGFNYRKGGSHAHLVEFGFITRNGKRVKGRPIVKETFEATKDQVLQNLIEEMKKTQATIERQIAR